MVSAAVYRQQGLNSAVANKAPCRVATTANITLSGLQTIDDISLAAGDRVLVKDQTTLSQNGIYIVAVGNWQRARDFESTGDIVKGSHVYITDGTTAGGSDFYVTSSDPIIVGTDDVEVEADDIEFTETAAGSAAASANAASASAAAAAASETNSANSAIAAASSASSAASSATSSAGSASTAVAAAEASGDVLFYDTKSDANTALGGLSENQIVEVMQDESAYSMRTRYRVESSAFDLKLYLSIDAIPTIANLATISGLYDGQVARVVQLRHFGHFKWRSGDMSTEVTGDPYEGLWVAPASDATGASGAWERMIEKAEYLAEWWLPDVMPTDAQVQLNAAIAAIADPYAKLFMPNRQVLITDTITMNKGIEYIGTGVANPVDGQGGEFYCCLVDASNAKLYNIAAGNVAGTLSSGEPGGFKIESKRDPDLINYTITENVSVRDCYGYDAVQGLRAGATNVFDNGDPMTGEVINVPVKDVYIENFRAREIGRIGIECFRAHGVQVVGGHVRLADTYAPGGLRRGVRLVGADVVTIQGLRSRGPIMVEYSGVLDDKKGCSDITLESIITEDFSSFLIQQASNNVTISGCRGIGYDDTDKSFLIMDGNMTEGEESRNIKVVGNQSVNQAKFIQYEGRFIGFDVVDNTFISNNASTTRFFNSAGNPANEELIEGRFVSNVGIGNGATTGGFFRYANTSVDTTLTIDDNKFTADSAGSVITVFGDGLLRRKSIDSNETLPSSLWATARPPLGAEEYP